MQAYRGLSLADGQGSVSTHPAPVRLVQDAPDFTVVVPMHNEAESVASLVADIEAACAPVGRFELVVVDDASKDETVARVFALMASRPWLRLVRHDRQAGQSAAIHSGVQAARAPVICMLDGDGQNPPHNLPRLLAALLAPGASEKLGLVAGQRVGRRDTLGKRLSSRFANRLRAYILNDGTRDTGCGLKAFRRDAYMALPFFNHQHRYLPALFKRDGWDVAHVDVDHRSRAHGQSHYTNIGRALVGLYDLVGVAWLLKRRKRAQWNETFFEGEPR